MQPWQCDSRKTRNTTRKKCCTCHARWRFRSPKCCTCQKNPSHLLKTSQEYGPCHTARLLTRYKTCCDVTKCHTCHAKLNFDLVWNLSKWEVSQLPPLARRCHNKTRESRREMLEPQNEQFVPSFVATSFLMHPKIYDLASQKMQRCHV